LIYEILTVFRKTGNHFFNTRCIQQAGRADTSTVAYIYREVWRILAHAVAYTGRYGRYG